MPAVGTSVPRKDAHEKVTGTARYVDDLDIPGRNVVALIEDDQPLLAVRDIHHVAEPLLLLAHADLDTLRRARVEIDYEREEPEFDPLRSRQVFKELNIR